MSSSFYTCGSVLTLKRKTELLGKAEYYNYFLLDPSKPGRYCYDGLSFSLLFEPFYVGKGKGRRLFAHFNKLSSIDNIYKNNKLISILCTHKKEEIAYKINSNLYEVEAYFIESEIIYSIGRQGTGPLCNLTDGGEHMHGISEEVRKSYGSPKEKHPLWGKGHTEESKRKISENRDYTGISGVNNYNTRTWQFTSPEGIEYIFKDSVVNFCKKHNLCVDTVNKHKNTGVVFTKHKRADSTYNSVDGWEFKLFKEEPCAN